MHDSRMQCVRLGMYVYTYIYIHTYTQGNYTNLDKHQGLGQFICQITKLQPNIFVSNSLHMIHASDFPKYFDQPTKHADSAAKTISSTPRPSKLARTSRRWHAFTSNQSLLQGGITHNLIWTFCEGWGNVLVHKRACGRKQRLPK